MDQQSDRVPYVVGLGGTAQRSSSTEKALAIALRAAERAGARVRMIGGEMLSRLPLYLTEHTETSFDGAELLRAVRAADGVIFASPGYHGTISGLFKNAVDYLEGTARDKRAYLHDMPVGLIATAYGWQATGGTLVALRAIAHALRGWPTPYGAGINTSGGILSGDQCSDPNVVEQLERVGRQVVEFIHMKWTLREGADGAISAECSMQ